MYFPNAELMIDPALLVLLGLIVGMLSGFFGVGGGFLITGGLLVFGVPTLYAVGSGLALVVGTSLMNTLNHGSMGNVDYRLGAPLVIGAAPAMYGAERVNNLLESHGLAGPVISYLYVALLVGLGIFILWDYWRTRRGRVSEERTTTAGLARWIHQLRIPPRRIRLPGVGGLSTLVELPVSQIPQMSLFVPLLVGVLVGFIAGLLGAGGGFFLTPVLIYVLGVPTRVAIGTGLLVVIVAASVGSFVYALSDRVDLLIALVMLVSASLGSQLGATSTRYVRASGIRVLYGVIVLFGGVAVGLQQVSAETGHDLLSTIGSVALLGTGGAVCLLLLALLVVRSRRGEQIQTG